MKMSLPMLVAVLALGACASAGSPRDADKLALYRANAGAPVSSFRFFGGVNSWTSLGDSALAVWTKPNEAYLLDLFGPCNELEFSHTIGLTEQASRVYAGFDKVLVRSSSAINIPCRIETIRPLDIKAIKSAERDARAQDSGT